MNTISAALVFAGIFAPIGALVGAIGMLLVHKNSAVKLLSEAQQIAQTTALTSANSALATVERRCGNCEKRLGVVEGVCEQLITATEALMLEHSEENRALATTAVWAARHAI